MSQEQFPEFPMLKDFFEFTSINLWLTVDTGSVGSETTRKIE